MPSDSVKLEYYCDINPEVITKKYPHKQIRYIDISSVGTGVFNEKPALMPLENAPSRAKRLVRKNDIIISTVRPNRRSFYFLDAPQPNDVASTGFSVLRTKGKNDPRFVYYVISDQRFTDYITSHAIGSAYPAVSHDSIINAPVPFFEPEEQMAIAEVLTCLDDKIALNRQMCETLEKTAAALFHSWFVDFDPVRAKMEGHAPEGMSADLLSLFPDRFEDSELGPIPRGWKVQPLDRLIEIISGGTPKTSVSEYWDGDIPWFSVVDAPSEAGVFVMKTEKYITRTGLENSSAKILPEGTTIVSARGTVGRLALVGTPMAMNQSCYGIRGVNKDAYWTYYLIKDVVDKLKQRAHGSIFDTITRQTFSSIQVVAPSPKCIALFEECVAPLLKKIRHNVMNNLSLRETRDALLPKLISGELRVDDVEG